MRIFKASNINIMASRVYSTLMLYGETDQSRNGRVIKFSDPIATVYTHPNNRMNSIPGRDSNPFFHIAEACWMLAGRKDVEYIAQFNKGMKNYSDNGEDFNAAYGYRMRQHYGYDQLQEAVTSLRKTPQTRQAVVLLWDANDLGKTTLDKACNMIFTLSVNEQDKINMVVHNRSNDLIYGGVTGSNPVHFSYILQYVADILGKEMGELTFVSSNSHVYLDLYPIWKQLRWGAAKDLPPHNYHHMGELAEYEKLCDQTADMQICTCEFNSNFINYVAKPVINTWIARRIGIPYQLWLSNINCPAIQESCREWINRRDS